MRDRAVWNWNPAPTSEVALISRALVRCTVVGKVSALFVEHISKALDPLGGAQGFRWDRIPGCYVTNFARHKALKLIARGKLIFDERVVLHRVDEVVAVSWHGLGWRDSQTVFLAHLKSDPCTFTGGKNQYASISAAGSESKLRAWPCACHWFGCPPRQLQRE